MRLTPYSQALFATNRYSVPVRRARREVIVKAYPFHIDIFDREQLIARHSRCYEHDQDIFDPLHYLPLLEQRPGAFDYAAPMRRWKKIGQSAIIRCSTIFDKRGQKVGVFRNLYASYNFMNSIRQR
jgi:hypothetical protein